MLRKIVLHGKLKTVYADEIKLCVNSVSEIVRALSYQIEGFREAISQGHYRICFNKIHPANCVSVDMINFNLGKTEEIHIIPVLEGAKGGGVGKIVAGIALVALSFALPGSGFWVGSIFFEGGISAIAMNIGISMAFKGVASLFSPQVKNSGGQSSYERPDERPSYLFNGPVNTNEQGGPVPLVFGKVRTGSQVISTGLTTENRE